MVINVHYHASGHLGNSINPLPVGHPDRVKSNQQLMGPLQPGPVDLRNFWSVLQTLGANNGDRSATSHP